MYVIVNHVSDDLVNAVNCVWRHQVFIFSGFLEFAVLLMKR